MSDCGKVEIKVTEEGNGVRADKYISDNSEISRGLAASLLESGL